jgi:hypothetical protein
MVPTIDNPRGAFSAHDIALAIAARLAVDGGIPLEIAIDGYREHLEIALRDGDLTEHINPNTVATVATIESAA